MHPKISANKLAEFIIAKTPARRASLVRQHLHKSPKGFAPFYPAFKTPATRFLEGGASNLSILDKAIERMKGRTGTPWLEIDSRITAEAIKALRETASAIQHLGVKFLPTPPRAKAQLTFQDLTVTVTPDMLVHGERNDVPLIGALRFYTAKESAYQLTEYGAELVAVMLHQWQMHAATGARAPDSDLCMVIECFQHRVTSAPADYAAHLAAIEKGARDFVALWHFLESEEAA